MRIAVPALFAFALLAGNAAALDGPTKGPKTKWGLVRVTNGCDDAVRVEASSFGTVVLEPNSSREFWVLMSSGKDNVGITASLVSDPTVSASHTCTVQDNKVTVATITSSVSGGSVSLHIDCQRPVQARQLAQRDTAVAMASGSGLAVMCLIGAVLGRAPGRRQCVPAVSVP